MKLTKADLNFLLKIEARKVFLISGYKKKRGGYQRFVGGEASFNRVRSLGLATIGAPMLGVPAYATLTDAGRAALSSEHEGGGK